MGTMWGPQGCGDHVGQCGDNRRKREDKVGTTGMWRLYGNNMETTWGQCGDHRDVETMWGQCGDHGDVETTWGQHEDNVETTWTQCGDHGDVETMWGQHGNNMGTT